MVCNRESWGRLLCTALYFFFCGVEYAVILPTLNGYLSAMNAPSGFIGIVLASFSFTGLISAPVYGRITDKTGSTKLSIIVSNLFEIGGNLLYFFGNNFYILWVSRLISGIGSGSASSILGMLSKTTNEKERTGVMSLLLSMRQVGLLVGPGFNVFLHGLGTQIGSFPVDKFTSPGLLMAAIWCVHTLLVAALFSNAIPSNSVPNNSDCVENNVNNSVNGEYAMVKSFTQKVFDEFVREEVVVCLGLAFMVMFVQTGIEAVLTPVTLIFFGWGGLYNSYLYCACGVVIILTNIILNRLSKCVSDRVLLATGCIGLIITYTVLLIYTTILYVLHTDGDVFEAPSWLLAVFVFDTFLLTTSLPFVWVILASLFSKLTSMESQGFNQGIRLAFMGFGQITGPIWAASLAAIKWLPIMGAVDLFLMVLFTILLFLSYNKLVPKSSSDAEKSNNDNEGENKALLDSSHLPIA